MQTYWDLSEKERAELSREDVERYLDAELMTKGVLKVKAPEFETEPTPIEPQTTFYQIKEDRFTTLPFAFSTAEDAHAFLALNPLHVGKHWNDPVECATPLKGAEVVAVKLYTTVERDANRSELDRKNEVTAANERKRREYDTGVSKQNEVLRGLWKDWHERKDEAQKMAKVITTYEEYLAVTKDAAMAVTFLGKVFARSQVEAAFTWHGRALPVPLDAVVMKSEAVAQTEKDAVAF